MVVSAIVGIVGDVELGGDLISQLAEACLPHHGQDIERYLDHHAAIAVRCSGADTCSSSAGWSSPGRRSPRERDPRGETVAADRRPLVVSTTGSLDLADRYQRHGDDVVHQLTGGFALAVWDRHRRRLMLAGDRTGQQTLYWRLRGGRLSFASQLRALLADPQISREVDPVALHHYLTYRYVPAPWSILTGIRKLPPGTRLIWENGRVTLHRYWELDAGPRSAAITSADAAAQLRQKLTDVVHAQLPATGRPQVLLSGGIGAALVAAAVAACTTEPVRTCAVAFADPRLDQSAAARALARHLGADHQQCPAPGVQPALVQQLAGSFDEPFGDPAAITAHLVARHAGVRLAEAFSGIGGGIVYGGFPHHLLLGWLSRWPQRAGGLPLLQRTGAALVGQSAPGTPVRRLGRLLEVAGCPPPQRYARIVGQCSGEQKEALYSDELRYELAEVDSRRLAEAAYAASSGTAQLTRMIDADVDGYLPGAMLNRWSAATTGAGLALRTPLLDHRLIEWAIGLPAGWKVPGRRRHLARQAALGWLPARLVSAWPTPALDRLPLAGWLRGELRDLSRDVLTDRTSRERGLFRPEAVLRLLDEHEAGLDHAGEIYALLQLELWLRHWQATVALRPVGRRSDLASLPPAS